MKKIKWLLVGILAGMLFIAGCGGDDETKGDPDKTTITYWQYTYPSKVEEIDKIIKDFEEENPDIEVIAQDYPHDQYQQKIFAAMKADKGPDIMNIYYGWVPEYVDREYIQPIRDEFMTDEEISDYYVDMVEPNKTDDTYYTLPIAVRSLALFWNKDMFEEAGLDKDTPPETWDEVIDYAKKMTVLDDNGRYEQEGYGWNVGGQGLHMFQQVMLRQFGVEPYSDDGKEVLWNSEPEGYDAFEYWVNMSKEHKIGDQNFANSYSEAFISGKAGMIIDGSFRIGDVQSSTDFDWGVTTLPVLEKGGLESNYASYWTNAIATGVEGKKLEASEKFLEYLIQEDVQREWMKNVGELPAAQALAEDEEIKEDPVYGPFVKGLEHAHATFFVRAEKEREIMMNKVDQILLNDADIDKTFDELVEEIQTVRDEYFEEH
ncbi:sn-glycerol-3-phosphate-binding periplasmic protein UgpB [Lentibacillus sp. JNUCC-1]|uniref:extracellular solute-binding protein n=1 Tax=Lentibacillus sp. JNUCC-1 TaxID=2654513 RepID=UPI0012E85592|nr:extracellular solute-binding protein [Lentibacillus sp. JNUCC-1]MUV37044.1 sn-glycerol-3-phosphate-binding periplasmic protein UgpB [Lentibacillus sp. JNUCC-1]